MSHSLKVAAGDADPFSYMPAVPLAQLSRHQVGMATWQLLKLYGPVSHAYKCTQTHMKTGDENASTLHCIPAQRAVEQVILKAKAVNQGHCIWPELPQQGILLLPDEACLLARGIVIFQEVSKVLQQGCQAKQRNQALQDCHCLRRDGTLRTLQEQSQVGQLRPAANTQSAHVTHQCV